MKVLEELAVYSLNYYITTRDTALSSTVPAHPLEANGLHLQILQVDHPHVL